MKNKNASPITTAKLLTVFTALFCVIALGGILFFQRTSPMGISLGKTKIFVVLSGSMSPELEAGSLILIRDTPPEQIKEGDIITYLSSSGKVAVTHRVMICLYDGNEYSFITKGDANEISDMTPVSESQIRGVVWYSIRDLGRILLLMRSPAGLTLLLLLLLLIIRRGLGKRDN